MDRGALGCGHWIRRQRIERRKWGNAQTASAAENGLNGNGSAKSPTKKSTLPRYLVERLLLDTNGYLETSGLADKALLNGHSSHDASQQNGLHDKLHAELTAARKPAGRGGLLDNGH